MAKIQRTKGQTTIYKTLQRNTNPTKNRKWTQVFRKGIVRCICDNRAIQFHFCLKFFLHLTKSYIFLLPFSDY